MSDNKKYYWLKLKEDFFSQPRIKQLRKIAGGDTYTIIYQKIMLLSIRNSGVIEFQNIEPTLQQELALILDEEVENIKIVLAFMHSSKLIEEFEPNCYLIPDVVHLIGSHTDAAERMKKMRERNIVTPLLQDVTQREDKKDKKEELEIKDKINILTEIINHFNLKTNKTKYQKGSERTTLEKYVNAIIKSGDTLEDIKNLIDYKLANPNTQKIDLLSWLNTQYVGQNMASSHDWLQRGKFIIPKFNDGKAESKLHRVNQQNYDEVF